MNSLSQDNEEKRLDERQKNERLINLPEGSNVVSQDTNEENYVFLNSPSTKPHPNKIVTSRYTLINFFPKNLYHQLSKASTFFFATTLILLCIPSISPFEPYSYALAFAIVVGTSMIKDAMEDVKRHTEDKKVNMEKCFRVEQKSPAESDLLKNQIEVQNVRPGDFLLLEANQLVPADVVVLRAFFKKESEICCSNHCFIETSNLDGENNLKKKNCLDFRITHAFKLKKHKSKIHASNFANLCNCSSKILKEVEKFKCKNTGDSFNDFFCKVVMKKKPNTSNILTADSKNVVLKGSVIKNTSLMLCLVVSVGNETKMAKSISTHRKNKSIFERRTEKVLMIIFGIYAIMLISTMTFAILDNKANSSKTAGDIIKMFFTNYILYTYLVPLSLFVSIEVTRIFHATYIAFDKEMSVVPEVENSTDKSTDHQQVKSDLKPTNTNDGEDVDEETICDERSEENSEMPIEITPIDLEFDVKNKISQRSRWNSLRCPEEEENENSNKIFSRCRNSNVIEDLGYVDYVLTDKTGTLTKNSMKLKKLHFKLNKSRRDVSMKIDSFFDQLVPKKYQKKGLTDKIDFSKTSVIFILNMLICNSVEVLNNNYEGISQEEISILRNLDKFNFKLLEREETFLIISFAGIKKRIEILHSLDFTSARQRQSVIVKIDDKTVLFTKGSDQKVLSNQMVVEKEACGIKSNFDAIKRVAEYVDKNKMVNNDFHCLIKNSHITFTLKNKEKYSNSKKFLLNVSKYRALSFSYKILSDDEYIQFTEAKKELMKNSDFLNSSMNALFQVMEFNSEFLGSTLIEDALQEKVKETILELQLNRIKMWMITGDKRETGISCGKDAGMIKDRFVAVEGKDAVRFLEEEVRLQKVPTIKFKEGLKNFLKILYKSTFFNTNREPEEVEEKYSLLNFPTVIVYRATPSQKGKVVSLLNKLNINTLAVGDGNNDVAMLKKASVGVGIIGKEGNQAVLNADFAIPSFRQLRKLILWHGKFNLIRFAKMTLNSFYKNLYFILIQFLYNFFNAGSGFPIYNVTFLNYFNTFYTAFIPIAVALFDRIPPGNFNYRKSRFFYSMNQVYLHFSYALLAALTCFSFFRIFLNNQLVTGTSGHVVSFSGESMLISLIVFVSVLIRQYRIITFLNIFAYLAIFLSVLLAVLLQWGSSKIPFLTSNTTAFSENFNIFSIPLVYFVFIACISTLYLLDTCFEGISENMVEVEYSLCNKC